MKASEYDGRGYDPPYPTDDDGEAIGSCDNCGCNLYRDEDYDGLCSGCAWYAAGCPMPALPRIPGTDDAMPNGGDE